MSEFESIQNIPEEPKDQIELHMEALRSNTRSPRRERSDNGKEETSDLARISVAQFRRLESAEKLRLLTGSDKIEPGKELKIDFGGNEALEKTITLGDILPPDVRKVTVTDATGKQVTGIRQQTSSSEFYGMGQRLIILSGYRLSVTPDAAVESDHPEQPSPSATNSFENESPETISENEKAFIEKVCERKILTGSQKANIRNYGPMIFRECEKNGLTNLAPFVFAQIEKESSWNPNRSNSKKNREASYGLMQINLKVHPIPACPFGITKDQLRSDPRKNLEYGIWYLAYCIKAQNGNFTAGLDMYNGKANFRLSPRKRYSSKIKNIYNDNYRQSDNDNT